MKLQCKMVGGANTYLDDAIEWVASRVSSLFRRIFSSSGSGPSSDVLIDQPGTGALENVLNDVTTRLDKAKADWDDVRNSAAQVKEEMDRLTGAMNTITEVLGTRYAQQTAGALANNIAARAEQWDALNAQAAQLANVVLSLQEQVSAIEAAAEKGMPLPVLAALDYEKKSWVDLVINAGQAGLLGTGFGGLARAGIMVARSVYERAKDWFLDEEHRLEEAIAAARDRLADLETKLREVREAKLDLELDFQDAQRNADDDTPKSAAGAHLLYR